jgi:hypothetical protein
MSISVHGVQFGVPKGWGDDSIHRFMAPGEASADPMVGGPTLVQNAVITRHDVPPNIPLERVFDAPNQASQSETPTFLVEATGLCSYLGQDAAYQDLTFAAEHVQILVCQRQIAVRRPDGVVVIMTMTCDSKRFARLKTDFPVVPKK